MSCGRGFREDDTELVPNALKRLLHDDTELVAEALKLLLRIVVAPSGSPFTAGEHGSDDVK